MEKRISILKPTEFRAVERDTGNGKEKVIEGYFARFDDTYDCGWGYTESISPQAFNLSRDTDVRFLTDHDTRLVLGRTSAGTGELSVDENGLFGRVVINPNDSDAMNTYARVERGDVSQCSFGFEILKSEYDYREDGTIHRTLIDVKLYEVSVCTFPAYTETSVTARSEEAEKTREALLGEWKQGIEARHKWLKGDTQC